MIWNKEKRSTECIDTLIAKDVVLQGDLEFSGGVQIDGRVCGTIKGIGEHSVVRITSNGQVEGDIYAPVVLINGKVTGSVYSTSHLELGKESHIEGDVHYELMEMLMGAEVNGKMMHEPLGVLDTSMLNLSQAKATSPKIDDVSNSANTQELKKNPDASKSGQDHSLLTDSKLTSKKASNP